MLKPAIITIDGPAASGKSTLGALLAHELGYTYFDTGVLYRALTYLALQQGIDSTNVAELVRLAEQMKPGVEPPTVDDGRQYTVTADGQDITWAIRTPEIERHVSVVSAHPEVRTALREQQRVIGRRGQVVMVGRDIGNVVMPDADLKIFLLASAEERARRRYAELVSQGREASYEKVFEDLRRRDTIDAQNTFQPTDAYIVNSDGLTPADILGELRGVLEQRAQA